MALSLTLQEKVRTPIIFLAKSLTKLGIANVIRATNNMSNRFLFFQSSYFKSFNPDLIIDIGANSGEFIFNTKSVFNNVHVLAFEPQKQTFASLKTNTSHFKSVEIFNVGLGRKHETVNMFISEFSPASSIVNNEVGTQVQEIKIERLDDYIDKIKKFKRILIKIDVEGYELEVLNGANDILSLANYIYIEVRPEHRKIGCSFDEIFEFLKNKGWRYNGSYDNIFDNSGELLHFDALFTRININ